MKISKSSISTLCIMLVAALALTALPELAHATDTSANNIGGMMCNVVNWFTGRTGKAIASIAIIVLGIAAFFGKVTWGMALMFGVGIFAIFGSAEIVSAINSKGGAC